MFCTCDAPRGQRLQLWPWISHLTRTHLNRNDGRMYRHGANYGKVTVLVISTIILNILHLLQLNVFESLRVPNTFFLTLTNHSPLQLVYNYCPLYFLQMRHRGIGWMALLLKTDLRERQVIHHLTEQAESNTQFWGSMLRFNSIRH